MSCSLRPSARTLPFPNKGSSVGIAFIRATVADPLARAVSTPSEATAFR